MVAYVDHLSQIVPAAERPLIAPALPFHVCGTVVGSGNEDVEARAAETNTPARIAAFHKGHMLTGRGIGQQGEYA